MKNIIKTKTPSVAGDGDSRMRYKVPDRGYSLSDLIRKQEDEK